MNASDLTSFLSNQLGNLPLDTVIENWIYKGKTNIAYGTKGGAWNAKDFPGYLFSSLTDNKQFIIRPAAVKARETIAIESVHNTGQLINYRLTKPNSLRTADGKTTLYESFLMTVGKGRVKQGVAKSFLFKHGLSQNGKILSFDDTTLTIESVLTGLLDWAVIRENAKNEIRRIQKTPSQISVQPQVTQEYLEDMVKQPLNQILYGPPGTGKTFHTITKALAIIEGKNEDELQKESRKILKKRFDDYRNKDQIVFTTFHQSMGYEDFIEGIKPKIDFDQDEDVTTETDKELRYVVEKGIFRKLCIDAQHKTTVSKKDFETLWSEYYLQLKSYTQEKIFKSVQSEMKLETELTNENTIWVRYKRSFDPTLEEGSRPFIVTKNTISKLFDARIEGTDANLNGRKETAEIMGAGRATHSYAVYKDFYQFAASKGAFQTETAANYVLIIDEINRGNISSIFGELITLIEDGKRQGQEEELSVKLPYSKDPHFKVPSNLYIIGTMNTADRSVESIDTALRRRFAFEEMLPEPELLTPSAMYCRLLWEYKDVDWEDEEYALKEESMLDLFAADENLWETRKVTWEKMKKEQQPYQLDYFSANHFHGINLRDILVTLNERIEALVDRDHTIGHAYLMGVDGFESLKYAFQHKIIPLLQEYFYGDYRKIEMVIGSGFFNDEVKKKKVTFAAHQNFIDQGEKYELLNVTDFEDQQLLAALEKMGVLPTLSVSDNAQEELSHTDKINLQ